MSIFFFVFLHENKSIGFDFYFEEVTNGGHIDVFLIVAGFIPYRIHPGIQSYLASPRYPVVVVSTTNELWSTVRCPLNAPRTED